MDDQHHQNPCFVVNDDGAVTVDWVVLTAAIIGLGILVFSPIASGTNSLATATSDSISGAEVTLTIPQQGQ